MLVDVEDLVGTLAYQVLLELEVCLCIYGDLRVHNDSLLDMWSVHSLSDKL